MKAAVGSQENSVRFLAERKVNWLALNQIGETAATMAARANQWAMLEYIIMQVWTPRPTVYVHSLISLLCGVLYVKGHPVSDDPSLQALLNPSGRSVGPESTLYRSVERGQKQRELRLAIMAIKELRCLHIVLWEIVLAYAF